MNIAGIALNILKVSMVEAYPLHEDFPEDDPGNFLRSALNEQIEPNIDEDVLAEMIYIANQRYISEEDNMTFYTALLGWRLVELAKKDAGLGRTKFEVRKI